MKFTPVLALGQELVCTASTTVYKKNGISYPVMPGYKLKVADYHLDSMGRVLGYKLAEPADPDASECLVMNLPACFQPTPEQFKIELHFSCLLNLAAKWSDEDQRRFIDDLTEQMADVLRCQSGFDRLLVSDGTMSAVN